MIAGGQADARRHPRVNVSWSGIVRTNGHDVPIQTVNVSVRGAKVQSQEKLETGTLAQVRLDLPDDRPLAVPAIVWRSDPDGLAFFFIDDIPLNLSRYSLVPA